MRSRAPNINRSHVYEDMVQRLTSEKPHGKDYTLFPTIRELLCFAALLGYSQSRRLPLKKEKGVEDVSYQQFEHVGADDLIFLIALSESKDPEILREGQEGKCAEIFEEYANGGLKIIFESLQQFGGEYPDRDILNMLIEQGYISGTHEESDLSGIKF